MEVAEGLTRPELWVHILGDAGADPTVHKITPDV